MLNAKCHRLNTKCKVQLQNTKYSMWHAKCKMQNTKCKVLNLKYKMHHSHHHHHRHRHHYFPTVAPLCRSSSGPSMLGISFKRPSTIICEVRYLLSWWNGVSTIIFLYLRNSSYLFWPGRGVSSFGQVQVVLQQQRVRGVEKWKGFHPDRTQVKLKSDMIREKNNRRNSGGTLRQKFNLDIQPMDQWFGSPID